MRICVLSDGYPPWDCGGAQKIAAQLATGYAAHGHDVDVITTVDGDDVGRSVVDGVTVHRVSTPRPRSLLPYLTVYNPSVVDECTHILDRTNPDVVHAHNVHWLSNATLRAAASRAPVVKTFHDTGTFSYREFESVVAETPVGESVPADAYRVSAVSQAREQKLEYFPVRNWRNRRTIEECVDVGIAVSDTLRRALVANDVACHRTIYNGVDTTPPETDTHSPGVEPASGDGTKRRSSTDGGTTRVEPPPAGPAEAPRTDAEARLRSEFGIGSDPFVLFGGRTGPAKGARHLAAAFRRVCERVDREPSLLVTGDRAAVAQMRQIASPYGDRIVTTGWLSRQRVDAAFDAARVVATPSVHLDPFPTVNLEAFAAGTPVVTTRFGGAKELVDDGVNGVVVDPRDIDALTDGLASFLTDSERATRFGLAGHRKVRREFTVAKQVDAYLDVLEAVTSNPGV